MNAPADSFSARCITSTPCACSFAYRTHERPRAYRALKRRDVVGKNTQKTDADQEEDEGNADLGKIVNLMQWVHSVPVTSAYTHGLLNRGDAYSVAYRFWQFSGFFLAPLRLTIALIYLYR